MSSHGYIRYLVADKSRRILSANSKELIGQKDIPKYQPFITRALDGSCVNLPAICQRRGDEG